MDSFDEEFERMRRMMSRLFNKALRDFEFDEEPFVYGFSMRTGPDGIPDLREFGHRPERLEEELGVREPLTDIIESGDDIFVTVELPGASEEDIDVVVEPHTLVVEAHGPKRYYHKEIALPAAVMDEAAKTTFRNGVLDVVLRKAERQSTAA